MSNEAIDWAIKQDASGNAPRKLILILLANRADDAWVCWPSRRLLAEESGLSIRQVVRHLASLEEDGLIRRVPWERADGGQGANVFALGPTATDAPVSCTTRGGGHVRHGGWSPMTRGEGHTRHPMNPKEKPAGKSSSPAAREESRRRLAADAARTHKGSSKRGEIVIADVPSDLDSDQIYHLVNEARRNPDGYARQIETIKSRARRLWRDAAERAADRYRELEKPDALADRASMDFMTYQYVLQLRRKNLPAWLIGPLLPFLEQSEPKQRRGA